MEELRDWPALLPDLLEDIVGRISSIEDFMASRGVCTPWRAFATKDKFLFSSPTIPVIMVAQQEHQISDDGDGSGRKKRRVKSDANLLYPLSRARIKLPNVRAFSECNALCVIAPLYFIKGAVLSENPSKSSDFILVGDSRSCEFGFL
ncbi:OLC1v1009959C1 [Oldenlandia corymbosa var. corymbosa]|uniref:OLC1v1009959C1 n=1 Tax=Oldenlandia corymbosa var. corymbosa TaxID=529605 RepID=A0AAV1DST7_OLDCO|nr:OLC1v1009959C1 [Oldenlandia corymbosa var. corymbosa]